MKMTETNLTEFPESMHHLIKLALEGKKRRLYSVGRIGDGSKIKSEQIKEYPYKIASIKVVPVRGYGGSYVNINFKNEITGELDQTSLPTSGEDVVGGLERKLGIVGNRETQTEFWGVTDRKLNNRYLKQFVGIRIGGVVIEHNDKDGTYNRLIGIFID